MSHALAQPKQPLDFPECGETAPQTTSPPDPSPSRAGGSAAAWMAVAALIFISGLGVIAFFLTRGTPTPPKATPSSQTKPVPPTEPPCSNCARGQTNGEPEKKTIDVSNVQTPWGRIPTRARGLIQRFSMPECKMCEQSQPDWVKWKTELEAQGYAVEEIIIDGKNAAAPGTLYALKCGYNSVPMIRHLPSGEVASGPVPVESLRKWLSRIERDYSMDKEKSQ